MESTEKSKKLFLIIVAVVLIIAIGIGIYFYFKISKAKQSQTGLSQPPAGSIEQPISTQPPATGNNNQTQEGFCGTSSFAACSTGDDCVASGCSGQICAGKSAESPISTCEWRECYDSIKYNLKCQCVSSQCQWSK